MNHDFRIKSLKVDGRAVPFDYMAFADNFGDEMCLFYNLDSGVRRRLWHILFPDFPRMMRAAKYPDAEDKEVEVEAELVPEDANGGAAREISVRGRALRELVGVESKSKLGARILAIHSLQLQRPNGAQGAAA